jgi:hypothetical protein
MSTEKSAVIEFVLKAIAENGSDVADDERAKVSAQMNPTFLPYCEIATS